MPSKSKSRKAESPHHRRHKLLKNFFFDERTPSNSSVETSVSSFALNRALHADTRTICVRTRGWSGTDRVQRVQVETAKVDRQARIKFANGETRFTGIRLRVALLRPAAVASLSRGGVVKFSAGKSRCSSGGCSPLPGRSEKLPATVKDGQRSAARRVRDSDDEDRRIATATRGVASSPSSVAIANTPILFRS